MWPHEWWEKALFTLIVEEGSSKGVVIVVQQHVSLDTIQIDLQMHAKKGCIS